MGLPRGPAAHPAQEGGAPGSGEMSSRSPGPRPWTTVAGNLQRLKAESGPESVVFYCGYPKQPRPFLQRLAFEFGSPNYCTESSTCFTAMAMAWRLDYGLPARPGHGEHQAACWCGRATPSTPHAQRPPADGRPRARSQVHRGRPAQVAHRRHRRPAPAPAPGTDGALALAMANVIIGEGVYDRQFVSEWSQGFDEFRAYAAEFTLGARRGGSPGCPPPRSARRPCSTPPPSRRP